ncbi:MAG TPA: hydroxymethylbilane synthase [Sedimentisphaerales bacterium]|nr:hydroxymethylbilane synthase [Sedimentisphaerales bacterium]
MKRLRIATRPSKLALAQTALVTDMLRRIRPDMEMAVVEVSTTGDRDNRNFLTKAPTVGFFTSEVENAVLAGNADIAVHSLKDLPTASNDSLVIAAIPPRGDPCDVVVASKPLRSLADLPAGAGIGTSSLRRQAQVLNARPDLRILPIRGNVETRIAKLDKGDYDAIVLAAAGLKRLSLDGRISLRLNPCEFMFAPGQGALAIQTRVDNREAIEILSVLDHRPTSLAAAAEREVLSALHGGCSIPLGVCSDVQGDALTLSAILATPDGRDMVRASVRGNLDDGASLARGLAAKLLSSATPAILACLKLT